ncbi:hypothetical protein BDEG_24323 [Batrachochytrium dendrobatidis JEL423]|uniref:Uncharacterized protein n=1 Tax=Batrachochytrium dendrobatidis (strain JEL423) TaxID=403673 RepID=A0A177WLB2_BATDL|nr:hypothetical protein BDEG_24323 [Batrachochytrium dendrobatidis JEL423]
MPKVITLYWAVEESQGGINCCNWIFVCMSNAKKEIPLQTIISHIGQECRLDWLISSCQIGLVARNSSDQATIKINKGSTTAHGDRRVSNHDNCPAGYQVMHM